MANPQAIIADAFEKLKRSISEEDAHKFKSTELKDVWAAVREIDGNQRKRLSAQNLRRIEPLLRGIEKYAKVIEVLCNGTPFLPYVWAPIKLMLEIASHHRDVFEALLSAYADIGAALPRFDRYKEAFKDNLEFQHVLATVYTSILLAEQRLREFHQRAYKFFRRRAWHVIFLSLWKDFGSRFDHIIESLKKQRDFVDVEAASFDIVEGKEARTRIQDDIQRRQKQELEMLEETEKNARISQLQHSLAWLSMDEKIQETEYERTSKRRHDKTCEWMANEPKLKSWIKDDARRRCLWLEGKPGSGKSVMCSYIVQTLTNTPGLTICYYFCNSQDSGNISQQILAIIVLQILRQHPDICTLIANEFVYRGVGCGMAQLRFLVPQLLEIVANSRIVVDGIDECSKENQKATLKELEAIYTGPTTRCKVLFSSRKEVHIYKKLSEQPQISLDGRKEVDWDIRSFVKYKMTKLRTSDQALLARIESILVEKANGMFLWVRLVVDELKYCYSDVTLEETARSLPKGLKAAYGRILDRIMDPSNSRNARYMAIRILGWMACSYRILKCYEILDGIAFDASNTTLTPKTKVRKDILDLCRPLIEDGPAGTVGFVHFSAKEYILEEEYQADRPFIWRENAHVDITFSCVAFLNSCISLLPENSTEAQRAAIIIRGFHGLQLYADMFWYRHLLAYCSLLGQHQRQFSPELLAQLQLLLRFRKEDNRTPGPESKTGTGKNRDEDSSLEKLNHLPYVKALVTDVLVFRAKIAREDASDKSPEKVSLDSCDMDLTHFSAIRYHYQRTTEFLLDDKALMTFPEISDKDLQDFREIYGGSAFVCRYLHCVFSTDGFESPSQRTKHESQHQRRFRCAYSSCFSFSTGCVTRNLLNKHNERYHPAIMEGPSLAESLALPQRTPQSMTAGMNPQQPLMLQQQMAAMRQQNQSMTAGMSPQQQLRLQQQQAAMRPPRQNQMQQRNNMQQNIAPGQQTEAQIGTNIPGASQAQQITQQQIQGVRNHPSEKMATAIDGQIRALLMRNPQPKLTLPQQEQRQFMQMQQTRMAQANEAKEKLMEMNGARAMKQVQQQRMQHAVQRQQQQAQVQARLNAQAKAQQIALQGPLQGQPGGLGPGPMLPQPSPAIVNLNAPLKTPSQQTNHSKQTQGNLNGFGHLLDPRFTQGRQPGPGNGMHTVRTNPAMLAGMPPEQQQRLANLPPENLPGPDFVNSSSQNDPPAFFDSRAWNVDVPPEPDYANFSSDVQRPAKRKASNPENTPASRDGLVGTYWASEVSNYNSQNRDIQPVTTSQFSEPVSNTGSVPQLDLRSSSPPFTLDNYPGGLSPITDFAPSSSNKDALKVNMRGAENKRYNKELETYNISQFGALESAYLNGLKEGNFDKLWENTALDNEQKLEFMLAKQAEIQRQIADLQPLTRNDSDSWHRSAYPNVLKEGIFDKPWENTALDDEQKLELILAKQAEIQAQIASLLPSTAAPSSYQFHRVPIHKQKQRQSSNVPRSMSSIGTPTMSSIPSYSQMFPKFASSPVLDGGPKPQH